MNKLTGPAKAAFERWFFEIHGKSSKKFDELLPWQKAEIFDWLNEACETIQHAFLIELFDFVGIYIDIDCYPEGIFYSSFSSVLSFCKSFGPFCSRSEATKKAIEAVIEFSNNLNN